MPIFVAKDKDFPVYATRAYRDRRRTATGAYRDRRRTATRAYRDRRRTAPLILNLGTWIQ
jgi:hypothetical protein